MSARSRRAAAGASGVFLTPGGKSHATSRGSSAIAASAGTDAATSQLPKPIVSPDSRAICTPIGLADVAVIQSADETARLAIVQYMRYPPSRRFSSSSGTEPAPRATESATGKSTPARAVLLGNAGAIAASVSTRLYASPSDEPPNRLTMNRLIRRPSPDFTTACATRNAMTTSSTLAFANPEKAFAGVMTPVNTTVATAIIDAVSSGYAPMRTDEIAATNTANRCHASGVSPAGTGASQMPAAMANGAARLSRSDGAIMAYSPPAAHRYARGP